MSQVSSENEPDPDAGNQKKTFKALRVGLSVLSLAATLVWVLRYPDAAANKWAAMGVQFFWAFAPPLWFLFEWGWWKRHGSPKEIDEIKYEQGLARNIWAGVAAILVLQYHA